MAIDLIGLGAASEKLLESISAAINVLYKPRAIRLEGKAQADVKAYEIEATATAKKRAMEVAAETEDILQRRAINRIRSVELLRQQNIDAVVEATIEHIEANSDDRDRAQQLDPDWISRYFDFVKDISDKDVRQIWAAILARQSTEGSRKVSLMTLDSLRLLERPHAILFREIALRVATFRSCFPFICAKPDSTNYGGDDSLHALEELGFINIRTLRPAHEVKCLVFPFSAFSIKLSSPIPGEPSGTQRIPEFGLTFRGFELARILLDDDALSPYWEDFRTPNPEDRFKHLSLEEHASNLRYWFDILRNQGGYNVEISVPTGKKSVALFDWRGVLLQHSPRKKAHLPPELELLLDSRDVAEPS